MNKLIRLGYTVFIPDNASIKSVVHIPYPEPHGCLRIDYSVPSDNDNHAVVLKNPIEMDAALKFFSKFAPVNEDLKFPPAKTVNLTPEISFWLK